MSDHHLIRIQSWDGKQENIPPQTNYDIPFGYGGNGFVKLKGGFAVKTIQLKNLKKKRIINEVQILRRISHPFIVKFEGCEIINPEIKLFFEVLQCGDLFTLVLRKQVKNPIFYFLCIAHAVGYLHQNKIVHRDIKTENIVLDRFGYPKLIDFGLSSYLGENNKCHTICGTVTYVAPEMIKSKVNGGYGCSVDLWSLVIILYELTHFSYPFYSDHDGVLLKKILEDEILLSNSFVDSITKSLLVKDPEKRITIDKLFQNPILSKTLQKIKNHETDIPYIPILNSDGIVTRDQDVLDKFKSLKN